MQSEISGKSRQGDFYNVCETCKLGCCNDARPPLTFKRKRIIRHFLDANHIHLAHPFESKGYAFPREAQDGQCIFLDRATRRCQIHPVKPETCVAGPITFDINRRTHRIEWFLKTKKTCPLARVLCLDKESLEKHVKSAKSEVLRLVNDLDSEALKVILCIEEPDTFKIGEDILTSRIIAKLRQ
jgi:Fe-S-cluster containining protein